MQTGTLVCMTGVISGRMRPVGLFLDNLRSEKGSGTVVRSTLRAVPATVPDPFSDLNAPKSALMMMTGRVKDPKLSRVSRRTSNA